MKALIKITLNKMDYAWLKSEMMKAGFVPKEIDDAKARYTEPHHEFYWNGPYTNDDLFEKIRKFVSVKNDSIASGDRLFEPEVVIRALN